MVWRVCLVSALIFVADRGRAQACEAKLAERIQADFITHVASDRDEYEVCEVHSKKESKVAFLKRSFGVDLFSKAETYESKEVFVKREPDSIDLHLGILVLHYPNEKTAAKILSRINKRDRRYFERTVVLTRYSVYRAGKSVVAIYSEKFRDHRVRMFLDSFDSRDGDQARPP